MRIQTTDAREMKWEDLKEATGENTTSGALDVAADYYLRMAGGTASIPTGALEELMRRTDQDGALTAPEIADVLDTDELPVAARTEWSVGRD